MTQATYKEALKLVLRYEGGWFNHPRDPGGPTNFGIIQVRYDQYRRDNGLATQSVKHISMREVEEIYWKYYALFVRYDELPAGVDFAVFDYGVNSGYSKAIKDLQRVVGANPDGKFGDGALAAVLTKDPKQIVIDLCNTRMAFLKRLNTFDVFGKGWTRRVVGERAGVQMNDIGVIDYAVKMADADFSYPLPSAPVEGKGVIDGVIETEAQLVTSYRVVTSGGQLNMRDAPNGNVLWKLDNGTEVQFLNFANDWWEVTTRTGTSVTGWVAAKFLEPMP